HHAFAKLCIATAFGLAALGAQALELRGFRGVMWGDGVEALGTAVRAPAEGELSCYQRENENLLFGDSVLNGVRYCFHNDHLVMVTLDAAVNQNALSAEFQRAYGRPDVQSARAASWGSKTSGARAELVAQGTAAARLSIYSNKIDAALAKRIRKLATAF
ncbi:MAG TPA: hypothetical protein VHQ87_05395, partial [Rhizobacter sp.]|nr:hypothetical protein [Rhizobacter sp.]